MDDSDHFENTLFSDVYEGCWQSVENIIRHNGGNVENGRSSDSRAEDSPFPKSTSEPFVNPIIAITGSRGSGKSSAMYSFAEYLKTRKNLPYSFSILPPIDATQFGKNESVIGNITASMYREYSNNNADLSVDKKRDFVRLAKEVNNTAVMYSTGEWFKCGDDLLQDSEKVGNLRTRLHELIMNYLNLRSGNPSDTNKYLVIMLDDLDMCSEGAYSIIEEIRKFLCMRNVIILMTMQSAQLRTVLQASYTTAFGKVDDETKPKIRNISMELAFRSYEKLFPAARCHAMPVWNADQLKNCDLRIVGENKKDIYGEDKDSPDDALFGFVLKGKNKTGNDEETIQEYKKKFSLLYRTLHMIWRKTLLIPVCNQDGEHLLIPNNLRSLHNFIAMFSGMDDAFSQAFFDEIAKNKKEENLPFELIPGLQRFDDFVKKDYVNTHILDKNLAIFENYLLDNLSTYGESLNHNEENQKLAETLQNLILEMHTVPLERLNAKIVGDILESKLPEYVEKAFQNIEYYVKTGYGEPISNIDLIKAQKGSKEESPKENDEREILKDAVSYADSISMGDVLYVLGKISVKTRCRYIAYLIEVIRTMWSIRMTREFYVNSKKDDSYLEVSPVFRRTVGGLMVDANTTAFTNVSAENDWYIHGKNNVIAYDDHFCATTLFSNNSDIETALAKNCLDYRNHNKEGKPYYVKSDSGTATGIKVCHYMAYYTNALDDKIIYFPFYSLDFMYRFYEEFRSDCRCRNFSANEISVRIFAMLDNGRIAATNNVLQTISNYIPLNPDVQSKNDGKFIYNEGQNNAIDKLYASINAKYNSINSSEDDKISQKVALATILRELSVLKDKLDRATYEKWDTIISELTEKAINAQNTQPVGTEVPSSSEGGTPSLTTHEEANTQGTELSNED